MDLILRQNLLTSFNLLENNYNITYLLLIISLILRTNIKLKYFLIQ